MNDREQQDVKVEDFRRGFLPINVEDLSRRLEEVLIGRLRSSHASVWSLAISFLTMNQSRVESRINHQRHRVHLSLNQGQRKADLIKSQCRDQNFLRDLRARTLP